MKNLKLLSLMLLVIGASFTSCTDNDKGQRVYNGDSLLTFNKGISKDVFVFSGTGYTEIEIDYGVLKAVAGTHTVSLVADTETSTAVEGTDFEVINTTDELTDGETTGKFTVKFLEGAAMQSGKVVNFKLVSPTLDATFSNSTYKVRVSLSCTIASFTGNFTGVSWWLGNSSHAVVVGPTAGTIQINDFWEDNATAPNFIVSYDDSFVITFAAQNTGYVASQGPIWARMSTDATKVSTLNPCTRQMTVWVNYYIPNVGSYGNKEEKFTGI